MGLPPERKWALRELEPPRPRAGPHRGLELGGGSSPPQPQSAELDGGSTYPPPGLTGQTSDLEGGTPGRGGGCFKVTSILL